MVAELAVDAAPRTRARPQWIHGPWLDAVVALCWVPFVVGALWVEAVAPSALDAYATAVFLLSFAHQPLTVALVYGDKERFALRRAIFTWSPIVFILATFVGVQVSFVLVAVIGGLWNAEHTLMQRYGLTRIYGRKAGQEEGRLELWMLFSWLGLALIWVAADPTTPDRAAGLAALGRNNSEAISVLTTLRGAATWLVLPALALAAGLFATWIVREGRRGAAANPAKWLYVGSTALLFGVILVAPLAGLLGYVGAHALEYFVVVHHSMGRRYVSAEADGGAVLGRAVRARPGRVGFFVVYVGIIIGIVTLLERAGSPVLYGVVFFTLGGLHVFYDGFIWKLRQPAVAASVGLPGGGGAQQATG